MAYDEFLSERIANQLNAKGAPFIAKKMMGGICYMVDDKMCVGVVKNDLMVRLNAADETLFLERKGSRPMDFTGKRMKGYLFINAEGTDMDEDLGYWVDQALQFNPLAKSSKKK